jgi:hypothetical protein
MVPTYALSPGGLYLSDCRCKVQGQGWELKKRFREGSTLGPAAIGAWGLQLRVYGLCAMVSRFRALVGWQVLGTHGQPIHQQA